MFYWMTDYTTSKGVTDNTTYLEAMTENTTSVRGMNEWRW
jgi:hypothetical protein